MNKVAIQLLRPIYRGRVLVPAGAFLDVWPSQAARLIASGEAIAAAIVANPIAPHPAPTDPNPDPDPD